MKKEKDVKNFHSDHLLAVRIYPHKKATCHFTEKHQKRLRTQLRRKMLCGWCWLGFHADSERR